MFLRYKTKKAESSDTCSIITVPTSQSPHEYTSGLTNNSSHQQTLLYSLC